MVQRHFSDAEYPTNWELVDSLAALLRVRGEWLRDGTGPATVEAMQERVQASQREARAAAASGVLAGQVSTTQPLDDANRELLARLIRQWCALPQHQLKRNQVAQDPAEVSEELRRIVLGVLERLPRHFWPEDERQGFLTALFGALSYGVRKDHAGAGDFSGVMNDGTFFRMVATEDP